MIEVHETTSVPAELEDFLIDEAKKELSRTLAIPKILTARVEKQWLVVENGTPLAVAGVSRQSLLGRPPEFWMLNTVRIELRHLRAFTGFMAQLQELYPLLWAVIDVTSDHAQKFARFYGFRDTGKTTVRAGHTYKIFRLYK